MSTPANLRRKTAFAGLGALLALAGGLAGAATASADLGYHDYGDGIALAATSTQVHRGAHSETAGDLIFHFRLPAGETLQEATWGLVLQVQNTDCDSPTPKAHSIEFAARPSVALYDHGEEIAPGELSAAPNSSHQCYESAVDDELFLRIGGDYADDVAGTFDIVISDVTVDVGADVAPGPVEVDAGLHASDDDLWDIDDADGHDFVSNATVINSPVDYRPTASANPGETGVELGTATYSEYPAGAFFGTGDTGVTLTLSDGTFTGGVTPQVTVPDGYRARAPETTGNSSTYRFTVTGPSTPRRADVRVSGLRVDAPEAEQTLTVDSHIAGADDQPQPTGVLNVLDYGKDHRLGGATRYDTAATLFDAGGYTSGSVVLSGGEKFPDALSANYLAGRLDTGTLLTHDDTLPATTRQAILDHDIDTVHITGGPAAVGKAVQHEIESLHVGGDPDAPYVSTPRHAGANRYATNRAVNTYGQPGDVDTVLLAAGTAPYDALSLGPIAAGNRLPLVLTKGDELREGELAQLHSFDPTTVVIAGDDAVVASHVERQLDDNGYAVRRLAGATRYDTAAAVAGWAATDLGFDSTTVNLTNAKAGYADALSAGPLAGSEHSLILLARGRTSAAGGLAGYLDDKTVGTDSGEVQTLRALGSSDVTGRALLEDAASAIGRHVLG